jgi:hypothetical protein
VIRFDGDEFNAHQSAKDGADASGAQAHGVDGGTPVGR